MAIEEWQRTGPETEPGLRALVLDRNAVDQARALGGRLLVRPGFDGVEIEATSHVGQVSVGPLRIVVRSKLPAMPLTALLRYAYGLRDLGPLRDLTDTPLASAGLPDILVALLAAEVEEVLHRGLARQYVPRAERLDSPRGQILMGELARDGGVLEARLPCRHVEHRDNWRLNQVLRAGLAIAGHVTSDFGLRRRLHKLGAALDGVDAIRLDRAALDGAQRSLTRLTASYAPALTLVGLLLDAQEVVIENGRPNAAPGFLFDMNLFFQRLLSRFLHDNLPAGWTIQDEQSVRGLLRYAPDANPRKRSPPAMRPDYTLSRPGHPKRFLDAKYRDVWAEDCPAEWLYQLSLYALAARLPASALLYATTNAVAREERIEVRSPASGNQVAATVILRPVNLLRLATLVHSGADRKERQTLALDIVAESSVTDPG